MLRRQFLCLISLTAGALAFPAGVQAAEITCFCANALRPALIELIAEFEKASGHTVKITYGLSGVVAERVRKGEPADFATVLPQHWDDLQKEGKLGPTRMTIAKVGVGLFVTKGAPKPDISSVDAFKRALLNARSVGYVTAPTNALAEFAARLFERLGIAAEMTAKNKYMPGEGALPLVARGGAEIGFTVISEVIAEPKVDYVGPFPAEIQNYTVYVGAVPKNAQASDAAKAFLDFLTSPQAATVFKTKGFEQG